MNSEAGMVSHARMSYSGAKTAIARYRCHVA